MPNTRNLKLSFAGGEISPEMFGRIDNAKYQSGVKLARNYIIRPQGPAENRAGFQFVREVKDSTKKVRLIPFTYSTTQTMVLEIGDQYIRFHTQGATLLNADNTPYEVVTPYLEADIFDIHYVQSNDVLTLVHPDYPPKELKRLGATNWTLTDISFAPTITAPTTVTATPNKTDKTDYDYSYVVTAVDSEGISESAQSTAATCKGNVLATGYYNTISWSTVSGASLYKVYKLQGGIYGYIGSTTSTSVVDDNISSDLSVAPPKYETVFDSANNYPGAVSYFEQRRVFAGTTNKPQNLWMTRSGTESAMSYSLPVRDDDRIAFRVASQNANTIRHVIPLSQLLLLTSSAEWRVTSVNSDAITPTSVSVKPQSYVGASDVQPVIVNNTLIYCAARGGHVRELAYNWQANGFITGDLSLYTPHLFDTYNIVDMAYSKAPMPIVWFVSSNGQLLGLTYVPEQQVGAWHHHDTTSGAFESCTVVAEGDEDVLYCVVKRTINGNSVRYVERMASRLFAKQEDAFFVDSGLTYTGDATDTISGLDHLEGMTVSILGDGAVFPQKVVTNGSITIEQPASVIHVGLPITSDIETLPLAMQIDSAYGQGRLVNINGVTLRVVSSSSIFAGPNENNLTEAKTRTTEPYGKPSALITDNVSIVMRPSWQDEGLLIRQKDPLPSTIVSLTAEVAIGG